MHTSVLCVVLLQIYCYSQGLTVLLHGAPGTGKTLAAEAIGYEVGKPLKVLYSLCVSSLWTSYLHTHARTYTVRLVTLVQVINCGELLSKWVGESTKNIDAIFEEARGSDAILVFDEAEGLFGMRTDMR